MLFLGLTLMAMLLVTFAVGLHVAAALGITAIVVGELFSARSLFPILSTIPWNALNNTTLVALPLFVLMGEILLRSGVTEGMYQSLSRWLNRLPGGLLHTNIAASAMFACISGSSAATAATVGGVALPYLQREGYSHSMSLGSLAAGGTLGILIPPSVVMIVYGVLAEASIGQLYMAGIVPGLLMVGLFMVSIIAAALIRPSTAPKAPSSTWREKLLGIVPILPIAFLMFLVLGTIYLGVATATEAAALGVAGSFLISLLNRRVNRAMLRDTFLSTASTTSMIMFILIGAFLLQFVVSYLGLPTAMTKMIVGLGLSPMQFILLMCVLYIILGMFMESLSIVVITVPVILPILKTLGIDLVWFGIILVILVEVALITPPVGMNLFIVQGMSNRVKSANPGRPRDIYIGILPFLVSMLATLGLIIAFPQLALWLAGR
ncbi:TRAP transporter large permease subunit [Mesorhizobium sp. B2-6-1]|uniref:TRAP transporter large permease n=1 Tax=Mesorhizobium sp. B2-6-1 TaxID=2589916 RepID=UPI00112BBFFE|nr:TRAP transporter large permease subunit [Mesorhizobium sp. B2-6-1]TPJ57626.1 TRAP transporter large permease subunit [Mesorhizobium sp. B2-6-1]